MNYTDTKKWCPTCNGQRRYLESPTFSYCVCCGGKVRSLEKRIDLTPYWNNDE